MKCQFENKLRYPTNLTISDTIIKLDKKAHIKLVSS